MLETIRMFAPLVCRTPVLLAAVFSLTLASAAAAQDAVKHYILIELKPGADQLALDRWCLAFHGPENRRAVKAWQRNYLSYRSYLPSEKAKEKYPIQFGRMTEIHFDSLADFRKTRENSLYGEIDSYTPPPGGWRNNSLFTTTTITAPVNPDELSVSEPTPPKETPYLRWIIIFDYPDSVSEKAGDAWWRNHRAKELAAAPGLKRMGFYRSVSDAAPKRRAVELWFDEMASWEDAFVKPEQTLRSAPWGEPFDDAAMMFVGENPDIDFVHDKRVVP